MDKLLMLQEVAYQHNIKVVHMDLHSIHSLLDGYAWPEKSMVFIDQSIIGTRHGTCVFGEETGHCLYPPAGGHILYHMREYYALDILERDNLTVKVARDESLALQWATNFLIPDKLFWEFARAGPHEWYEWPEHFGVADWFMRAKIGFMRRKHPFKWRDIIRRNATG